MRRIAIAVSLFALGALTFCAKEEDAITIDSTVQTELSPYFSSFASEALKRGVTVDVSQIGGKITNIAAEGVAGQCQHSASQGHQILIDPAYWSTASSLAREYVVFHELGHCALGRAHRNDSNANGTCASIMQSGSAGCKMVYTSQTRSAYLDELFLNQ